MSEKLPTLANTYLKSSKLYVASFIDVLPFILLLMLVKFVFEKYWPQETNITLLFFIRIFIDSAISALFFSMIISTIYQKHSLRQVQIFDAISNGCRRFGQVYLAYLFISLPLLLAFILIKIDSILGQTYVITPDVLERQRLLTLGLIGIAFLITAILVIYCFVGGVNIVLKGENARIGLQHSCKMVHSYWIDTFLIVALFGIIIMSISLLMDEFHVPIAGPILMLLMSSFYPSLMIVHEENMAKLAQAASPVTLTAKAA